VLGTQLPAANVSPGGGCPAHEQSVQKDAANDTAAYIEAAVAS